MTTARPLLMAAPMVRSTIEGRKTQTRRTVKLPPWSTGNDGDVEIDERGIPQIIARTSGCFADIPLRYKAGDLLWVKETWAVGKCADGLKPRELSRRCWIYENGGLWYEGQEPTHPISPRGAPRSSMFMPRWASRLTLEITDVRVERLQDISKSDAEAEGIEYAIRPFGDWKLIPGIWDFEGLVNDGEQRGDPPPAIKYAYLWNSINAKAGTRWADNPWVWVLTFAVHHANVDAVLAQLTEVAA